MTVCRGRAIEVEAGIWHWVAECITAKTAAGDVVLLLESGA